MTRVYISGKNGFIGSHLFDSMKYSYELLEDEYSLDYIDKIRSFNPEVIIHCAAKVGSVNCKNDFYGTINSNVLGTFKISQVAKDLNSYFIFLSSIDVYDFCTEHNCITEYSRVNPKTFYGASKFCGEKIVENNVSKNLKLILLIVFVLLDEPVQFLF